MSSFLFVFYTAFYLILNNAFWKNRYCSFYVYIRCIFFICICMKNFNKNFPFSPFYTVSHLNCLKKHISMNTQKHSTPPPPDQISPRRVIRLPHVGRLDTRVGAVQTGVQFGWYFMRVINHFYLPQSIQLSL